MPSMDPQGVIRGKPVKTTVSDKAAPCPLDHQFRAPRPNALWVSDFTYVATWTGFVYVAFVIHAYARRVVGWRASRTAQASFVLDALEQAQRDRTRPVGARLDHVQRRDPFRMPVGLGHTGVVEVKMHHVGVGMRQREGRPDAAKRLIPGFAALDSPHALISGPERTARPRGSPHRGETALPRVAPLPSPLRSCDPKRW